MNAGEIISQRLFVTLKLCGVIDWSWWWVTAPFWGPLLVVVLILLICLGLSATFNRKP